MGEKKTQKANIAGIILAAGESTRFGAPKQLEKINGETMLAIAIDKAKTVGLDPIVVVVGAHADQIIPTIGRSDIEIVVNSNWTMGISASIRAGIESLPGKVECVLMMMTDQPKLPTELMRQLIDEFDPKFDFIVPVAQGVLRNPVIINKKTFPRVLQLEGDAGARTLFPESMIKRVTWEDELVFQDIDTKKDLNLLENS
jgi:molybdenum cofactor cytidylyltransferase